LISTSSNGRYTISSGIIGESLQLTVPVDGPTMVSESLSCNVRGTTDHIFYITRPTYTTSDYHSPLIPSTEGREKLNFVKREMADQARGRPDADQQVRQGPSTIFSISE